MRPRGVAALAGVATLLAAYLLLVEPHRPSRDQGRSGHPRLLTRFDRAAVRRIAIGRRGQPGFAIERAPAASKSTFRMVPGGEPADDAAVEDLLAAVDFTETERTADLTPAAAGLTPPAVTLELESATGSASLRLGSADATGGGVFVSVDREPDVRVASRRLLELGDREPSAFRDRRLVPLDPAAITGFHWMDPSRHAALVSRVKPFGWYGGPYRENWHPSHDVDSERVDESLRRIFALRVDRFVAAPPEHVPPSGKLQLSGDGPGELTILEVTDLICVGGGTVVARQLPDRREGVCVDAVALAAVWSSLNGADAQVRQLLPSSPDAGAVLDFAHFDVRRLRRSSAGSTMEMASDDGEVWRAATPPAAVVDSANAARVVGALGNLRAEGFVVAGPTRSPELRLEVVLAVPGQPSPARHVLEIFDAPAPDCLGRLDHAAVFKLPRAACDELRLPLVARGGGG